MIKIEENKYPQHNLETEKFFQPEKLYLVLSQNAGKPPQIGVKVGEEVEEGTLVADLGGFISSKLHAPKKGKVVSMDYFSHPTLGRDRCITLKCEEEEKSYQIQKGIDNLSSEGLIERVKNAGIVGMGGACFPTHVKLTPPKKIDTLIINGCECEPYLACDYRLMVENTEGIFKGVEIVAKIVEPKKIIFCIEDNKPEAIKKFNLALSTKRYNLPPSRIAVVKPWYPQGGEKQLIHKVTKRKIPSGKLPFDVGCLVHNVGTCFAIYEAVYFSKPLIERLVTFAGDCLVTPKNLWVKIGTSVKELKDKSILEFKKEPKKIIFGGPMMGIAVDSLNYPIMKGTGGVLFLSREKVDTLQEGVCIRCARCVDSCPMNLLPLEYARRVKNGEFNRLKEIFIKDCIECGCCAAVCPAKIPLVHYIKTGKKYAVNN